MIKRIQNEGLLLQIICPRYSTVRNDERLSGWLGSARVRSIGKFFIGRFDRLSVKPTGAERVMRRTDTIPGINAHMTD